MQDLKLRDFADMDTAVGEKFPLKPEEQTAANVL